MKKKIGILTQPLHDNYGGLFQAYALKEVLESLGYDVVVINRQIVTSEIRKKFSLLKSFLTGRKINKKALLSKNQSKYISKNTASFIKKFIPNLSPRITSKKQMNLLNSQGFYGYVVGSDQSWRPKYSPDIYNYFLDFAENQKNIKRITYAVSFGVSEWEFTEVETKKCRDLASKFDSISVREDSGVELVKNYFALNSTHVVDPTMLLSPDNYKKLIDNSQSKFDGLKELNIYVLDKTLFKKDIIDYVKSRLNFESFEVLPKKNINDGKIDSKNIDDFVFPHPLMWLTAFEKAKFVITDSFHGTVFSILNNVPFIAIGNQGRGLARFESLLRMFGLEDRLITDFDKNKLDSIIYSDINWFRVNEKVSEERKKGIEYLKENLK
ncbi:MurB family protein [Sphingobacterium mizutaii NBRC 14946 = DSM 11724]|uniref:Exopolysaccharide biosynthesis protein n=2 Tax=Sphingobacterium mizutaii TaxID=1010 RepID=A0AAJ4XGZ8_9SPHI|nr:polysaccharide pyruvyl transferase family protein [Sphingobacterium mizutaii]GEM66491.1 MurB family protein [Sphingobacterium mizutaii NBRC 14946 = DSM 11724]SDL53085.1 Polysaccharide pyruvyl transferase [Sphingobacterium mizutaii]SNV62844.1 Exopolysaccharide biosynthesis protein [Sphingobacterium mizutaii]